MNVGRGGIIVKMRLADIALAPHRDALASFKAASGDIMLSCAPISPKAGGLASACGWQIGGWTGGQAVGSAAVVLATNLLAAYLLGWLSSLRLPANGRASARKHARK